MFRFITLSFERWSHITFSYISWVQPNLRYLSLARTLRTTTAYSCARSFSTILSTVGPLNFIWLNGGLTEVMSHDNKMNSGHIFKWPIKKCWRAGVTNFDGYSHHSSMKLIRAPSIFLIKISFLNVSSVKISKKYARIRENFQIIILLTFNFMNWPRTSISVGMAQNWP